MILFTIVKFVFKSYETYEKEHDKMMRKESVIESEPFRFSFK